MKQLWLVIAVAIAFLGYNSLFVVNEGARGIVIQFGKVKRDAQSDETLVFAPGLHFKVPLFDQVKLLDARVQTLDGEPDRFVTSEKKDLIVDSYVKWRISDFAKYYLATSGGIKNLAEALLKQKVNNGLRSEFGTRTIAEIVSGERSELMDEALESAKSSDELGIEIVDVRVKQINLPLEVSNSIFDRMRAERTAVAKEHRSEGQEQAEIIRANVDRRVTVMLADAERNARKLRGEGDASAAQIYADTYTKSPEFYSFLRSMDAYRASFNSKQDVLVVEPTSDFFKYLKNSVEK